MNDSEEPAGNESPRLGALEVGDQAQTEEIKQDGKI